ncbi:Hsp20/alpha crystallin family protein [Desulfopila inferna]|uniref:Hsp20/alpha crystallin family protein n=1 Tax=Desulfopila inferna TaxID=468528 RepID=UPI0019623036|nr:Hsp20/alpha crystallin family protein [Desulfopila inferna]MBM9606481.1 Hsp20/alpha crystallin family protein [Desulfopila inferna]
MTTKREVIRRPASLPQRMYEIHTLFHQFLNELQSRSPAIELPGYWIPNIDIYETNAAVVLEIEVPGITPKDFDFTIDGDLIRIKGEKRQEIQEEGSSFRRLERRYGMFERILRLPAEVSEHKVGAIYQDGILKITLPKKASEEQLF